MARSTFGSYRPAPNVSAATTAYPSIAARSNGGTSRAEIAASARTRLFASRIGTRSTRSTGIAASIRSAIASPSGIVSRMGLIESLITKSTNPRILESLDLGSLESSIPESLESSILNLERSTRRIIACVASPAEGSRFSD